MKHSYINRHAMACFLLSCTLLAVAVYGDDDSPENKNRENLAAKAEFDAFRWAIYQFHLMDTTHAGYWNYLYHNIQLRDQIDLGDTGPTSILRQDQCRDLFNDEEEDDDKEYHDARKGKGADAVQELLSDPRSYIAFRHHPGKTDLPKGFIYSLHGKECRSLFHRKGTTNLMIRFKKKEEVDIGRRGTLSSAIVGIIKNCGGSDDGVEEWELTIDLDQGLVYRRNLIHVDCPNLKRAIEKAKDVAHERQFRLNNHTTDVEDKGDVWEISFPPLSIKPGGSLHITISKETGQVLQIFGTQ